ncbi:MAG: hypothetical protein LBN36_05285, partial [Clostridiales Family XIII bacterium]|nr:hypothetical protein [Clostridiales Family XIII bacterium]
MKRFLGVAMILIMLFTLTSCGGTEKPSEATVDDPTSEELTEEPTSEASKEGETDLFSLPEDPASSYSYVEIDGNIFITRHVEAEEIAVVPS